MSERGIYAKKFCARKTNRLWVAVWGAFVGWLGTKSIDLLVTKLLRRPLRLFCSCILRKKMRGFYLIALLVALVVSCHAIVNKEVNREIDLTSQFEIQRLKIEVLNDGSQAVSEYVIALTGDDDDDLAFVEAKEQGTKLKVGELKTQGKYVRSFIACHVFFFHK